MTPIPDAEPLGGHSGDGDLDNLLNEHFAGRVVRKDLTKLLKEGENPPLTGPPIRRSAEPHSPRSRRLKVRSPIGPSRRMMPRTSPLTADSTSG